MPLDQAVLEHQVVGGVPAEEGSTPQVDVVVVAARRDMVSSLVEPLRRAGLEPIGVDLSAFGMIRALADVAVTTPAAAAGDELEESVPASRPDEAVLYCNVGDVMNLAVARGRACLFTRVSNVGMAGIVNRLSADLGLSPEHASQWLTHVGLQSSVEQVEGDPQTVAGIRGALEAGVTELADELRLSLDYYRAQESAVRVGHVVLCGPGSAIPGLSDRIEVGLGIPISAARPPALSGHAEDVAARLTLPYGLALNS